MKIKLHSLHWDNFDKDMLAAHKKVMNHFDLDVQYTNKNIKHGVWLDEVIGDRSADVIGIIEPDLVPLNREIVDIAIRYVIENDSMIGCAQVSNHKHPQTHVFASPSFFFITRSCYERLGRPSFKRTQRGDVGEEVSYRAERLGVRYRTLFPTHFEREPRDGVWPLGSYGYFGVGTVFANAVYHLYQGRFADNVQLFVRRCEDILAGRFSTEGFNNATDLFYPGRIEPLKPKRWYQR